MELESELDITVYKGMLFVVHVYMYVDAGTHVVAPRTQRARHRVAAVYRPSAVNCVPERASEGCGHEAPLNIDVHQKVRDHPLKFIQHAQITH